MIIMYYVIQIIIIQYQYYYGKYITHQFHIFQILLLKRNLRLMFFLSELKLRNADKI